MGRAPKIATTLFEEMIVLASGHNYRCLIMRAPQIAYFLESQTPCRNTTNRVH